MILDILEQFYTDFKIWNRFLERIAEIDGLMALTKLSFSNEMNCRP